ncbi:MAG: hypothetical protein RL591_1397, partial [Planctomycetota bacterium]
MIDQNGASESENKFEASHVVESPIDGDPRSTHTTNPHASDTGDATAANQRLDGNADSNENPEFDENPGMGFGFTEADDLAAELAAANILSVEIPKHHGSS